MQVQFEILSGKVVVPSIMEVKELSTGREGKLYVCHVGQIEEDLLQEADWVASCFLPKELSGKSPFGNIERGQQGLVEIKVRENKITLTTGVTPIRLIYFLDYSYYPQDYTKEEEKFQVFTKLVTRSYKRLSSIECIRERVSFLVNEMPDSVYTEYYGYQLYILYILFKEEFIPSSGYTNEKDFFNDWLKINFDID